LSIYRDGTGTDGEGSEGRGDCLSVVIVKSRKYGKNRAGETRQTIGLMWAAVVWLA
jgi:hypothetical protein